ncbi:hypothetical protein O53_1805 [Microcystis aeruginosa TAIHU98]|uniref:Uncharacterized protein n=1 Tax=Microcystis aeruginosa TAIHU98 TaxID=1134457 RepID=L7EER6_MICAE|nr:hypothetical protein O53_1805 [Microcystis aeruginosa TAIHU98]
MFWYFWNGGDIWLSTVAQARATVRDIINLIRLFLSVYCL